MIMATDKLHLRLSKLRRQIHEHNYRYHVLDDPVISDYEFDKLMKELLDIEKINPELVTDDSPTQRIGGSPREGFSKINHPALILSLANAFSEEDIRAWYERILKVNERVGKTKFTVEPKIDGLTVVLHYNQGQLVKGATRGNGEIGEDITSNIKTIRSVPLIIPIKPDKTPPDSIVVRGEAFITTVDFDLLNSTLIKKGEKPYLNPRNTAAGALRQLDPRLTSTRPLKILVYQIVSSSSTIPETQLGTIQYLSTLGFPVPVGKIFSAIEDVIDYCVSNTNIKDDYPFEIDGLVIKLDDLLLADELGVVGKDPRGAIAYKFPPKVVTTYLNRIGVKVGRTGVLTPYAEVDPVEIGGVTIQNATLHNFDFITQKDIRIGDKVQIIRAGDVIPYVIGPVLSARDGKEKIFYPPEKCPVCDAKVQRSQDQVAIYCQNASCPEQLIRNLEHFVSKAAMNIIGVGFSVVQMLIDNRLVNDVADLYYLDKKDLLKLPGFSEKRTQNVLDAINESKTAPLSCLLIALGIRGVGEVNAQTLAKNIKNLDQLSTISKDELISIEGLGPNIAESIISWINNENNKKVLKKLHHVGVWPKYEEAYTPEIGLPLDGKIFVISGTLQKFTREKIKEFIRNAGGKVTNTISNNTNYLVYGDKPGSKLEKARAMRVTCITEAELLKMVEGVVRD